MGTFTLDITSNMNRGQIAEAYRRTSRESFRWQRIALALAAASPDALSSLSQKEREAVERAAEAYK